MRYLITGGAGFIGSHLAETLLERGHEVHIYDNLSTGQIANVEHLIENDRFHSTIADVTDRHTLEQCVAQCDHVFHLAAAVGVKLIMEQPVETIRTNVRGTELVLDLAHKYDKKVLIASTSEVYGKLLENNRKMEALEEGDDWRLGPTTKRRWAYACSKAMDEFLALAYYDEYDLPVVLIRFFNTVGPRQTGRYGMVIPNFIRQALAEEPIQVYGDGCQTRCFTYVEDAVEAITRLMETPDAEGRVFNVGSTNEISINDLAKKIRDMTGSASDIVHIPYEEVYGPGFEDMRRRTPDITALRETISFEPEYSIEEILHQIIAAHPEPTPLMASPEPREVVKTVR
jgi:UDP-glucose 4-epimerase